MYWRFDLDTFLSPAAVAAWPASAPSGSGHRDHCDEFTDPLRQDGAPATPRVGEEGDQERGIAGHA